MEKRVSFIKKSIKGLFVISMAVQIILGILWMGANFLSVQQFAETKEYLEASRTFRLDEYMGILYPLILRICPLYPVLYLLQLIAAFLSNCIFMSFSGIGREKLFDCKNIFGALYLMTIPFIMQLHMSVLPQSFVLSLLFVQLAYGLRFLRKKAEKELKGFIICCVLWAGMALLLPDYLWLGGITVFVSLLVSVGRRCGLKRMLTYTACAAGCILFVLGVNALTQTPGSRGNIQRTLGAAMVSRLAWPNFEDNYYFWPEEVKAVMSPMDGRAISQYADNVKKVMGPMFEKAFGKEQANAYYWQMALRCFSDRTKEVLLRIEADYMAYLFAPFSVWHQLAGGGVSYSGYNYDRMWAQAKELSRVYMQYGKYSLYTGLVFALAMACIRIGKKQKPLKKGVISLCIVQVLIQVLWYTMSGTWMMDYKNVPIIMALWYACILWGWKQYDADSSETTEG